MTRPSQAPARTGSSRETRSGPQPRGERAWTRQARPEGSRERIRAPQNDATPRERRFERSGDRWREGRDRSDARTAERWRSERGDWNRNRSGAQNGSRVVVRNDRRWDTTWRNGSRDNRGWDRGWRNNNRYNWSAYRARNQSIFRPGRYYAPHPSYSYRRIGVGFTLGTFFYGQRYWISDPWQYRLPAVYDPYRWVRYYDDVVLVDTYSGQVVDVIYDFFW